MLNYKAPQRDVAFVMDELLGFFEHYEKLGFADATPDMVQAILQEGGKFAENILAPLNAVGDTEGCSWHEGVVTTPKGFKEAYQQYVEGGWPAMSQPLEYDGQGLPYSLSSVLSEWFSGANHAWAMYPGLSQGCIETILAHGSDSQRQRFLPHLIAGRWTGTMCLTEPHCGSDLGLLKTKAEPQPDGAYAITGTKIFISAGDHDLSDNIVHVVLARLPDAPAGTKGISLFIVPKFNVSESGEITTPNTLSCGSLEHKMGIKGSATCVMNFDGARGYLIGEPNRGLNCMFTFMNAARVGVGLEGLAATEAAFQGAISYARDRLQMRSLKGPVNKDKPADPIIVHPDVRRMLLTQKAIREGGRALAMYCTQQIDLTLYSEDADAKASAEAKLALLTPIVKAFLTETAQECTSYGMQVYGGHGFIKEWGMEQLARDTRICTMYEGTTGIQAIDLLARKIIGSKGELLRQFVNEIRAFCETQNTARHFSVWTDALLQHLDEWLQLAQGVAEKAQSNPDEIGAASVEFLMYSGYVCLAYFWLRMALTAKEKLDAQSGDSDFYQAKLHTAEFYFERLLPRTRSLAASVKAGSDSLMALPEELFHLN
ncbi:acyl-CoA dehydrogenase C-terminal domain-containing protein [Hahella aquimaris]|uniref:acyl-CoA dehydrogenase C-terminal domain-containing protein n=1 Tax=Hahella sp. HNIBRBA332 TaxID=3015983 RepID=UPI00273BB17E|nr:acyl-CoA dehydrogenase C-terminal domain-containing protein [Hahella sp. HNIBRBA332]WLQ11601.1 acyl-CoA dehydrogenase C-terminal domain-containing protein [Hahella sp. HNIBRBA332]